MSQRTIRYTALSELHAIKRRLLSDLFIRSEDRASLISIIEDIAADRDVRERFRRTERGAPRKDEAKKLRALIEVAKLKRHHTLAESIEIAAKHAGLTLDAVIHEYKRMNRSAKKLGFVKGINSPEFLP